MALMLINWIYFNSACYVPQIYVSLFTFFSLLASRKKFSECNSYQISLVYFAPPTFFGRVYNFVLVSLNFMKCYCTCTVISLIWHIELYEQIWLGRLFHFVCSCVCVCMSVHNEITFEISNNENWQKIVPISFLHAIWFHIEFNPLCNFI